MGLHSFGGALPPRAGSHRPYSYLYHRKVGYPPTTAYTPIQGYSGATLAYISALSRWLYRAFNPLLAGMLIIEF